MVSLRWFYQCFGEPHYETSRSASCCGANPVFFPGRIMIKVDNDD